MWKHRFSAGRRFGIFGLAWRRQVWIALLSRDWRQRETEQNANQQNAARAFCTAPNRHSVRLSHRS